MIIKYGTITDEQFNKYKESLIGRIYAILPMKEENSETVGEYIDNLNRELIESLDVFARCERVVSVVCLLNGVAGETDHDVYRKLILKCCNILAKEEK